MMAKIAESNLRGKKKATNESKTYKIKIKLVIKPENPLTSICTEPGTLCFAF